MRAVMLVLVMLAGGASAQPIVELPCEERDVCVDVQLHVADGVAPEGWIENQVRVANRHFAPIGVGVRVIGADARSVPHVASREDRNALAAYLNKGVIDVFVTGRLDDLSANSQIRGVAWRKGTKKFVILSAIAGENVLAHELGHVFGLPHSTYAISIMNKTPREEPPWEVRTFAPEELIAMTRGVRRLVRARVIDNRADATRRSR